MSIVALGVGCGRGADADELAALARTTMALGGVSAVDCVATLDGKETEPAIRSLAQALGAPLKSFSSESLRQEDRGTGYSVTAQAAVGTPNVSEAAALIAAGAGASILVSKQKSARCTAAIAVSTSSDADGKSTSGNSSVGGR